MRPADVCRRAVSAAAQRGDLQVLLSNRPLGCGARQKIEREVTSHLARLIVYGGTARPRRTTADVVPLGQFAEFLGGLDALSPLPELKRDPACSASEVLGRSHPV